MVAIDNRRPPPGVKRIDAARLGGLLPDIPVRCRRQAADEKPRFARSRLGGDIREVSGALGDLGTLLPYVLGALAATALSPVGVLVSFGLAYIGTGLAFGLPLAVQPMKAATAIVIADGLSPGEIAGAGLAIGLLFLVLGLTGALGRLVALIPPAVIGGLQVGLAATLMALAFDYGLRFPAFGAAMLVLMLVLLVASRRLPAALVFVLAGVLAGQAFGLAPPLEPVSLGFSLPEIVLPGWSDLWRGAVQAALPQVPVTIANAIVVTAVLARDLFPREVHGVTETRLAVSTGIMNLAAAPIGGLPMCHGAGGLAAHYRFGGRSGTAPVAIGLVLLLATLALGDDMHHVLALVPDAVIGVLLGFAAWDLARSARVEMLAPGDAVVLGVTALATAAWNPVLGLAAGAAGAAVGRLGR